jgi:hypothetical protein
MTDTGTMSETQSRCVLTLEIDRASDPITGRVSDEGQSKEADFVGRLGLASALEQVLEIDRRADPAAGPVT